MKKKNEHSSSSMFEPPSLFHKDPWESRLTPHQNRTGSLLSRHRDFVLSIPDLTLIPLLYLLALSDLLLFG
ncbi:unnamed protein product [Trifolium pratense]|uniref:Uncharacterized protein n=1 Tax=Trifolium pratense TaxID=57577 RepID=A0ACB0KU78_TRIPR|nr:unnamed protein product [Trifolium pratense]